jgi:ATP-binding cassette subfamily C protein LapB
MTLSRDGGARGRRTIQKGNLLLATLAISILSLALPVVTIQIYDRILPNPQSGTLPVLITGVCVAVILEFCLRLARGYILHWNGAVFEHKTSCEALNHLLLADLSVTRRASPGEYLNRLSAIGRLKDFFNGYRTVTLFELVLVPIYLGLIYYIAGDLVFAPVCILGGFAVVAGVMGGRLRHDINLRNQADDRRYDFFLDTLDGMHSVKAYCLEDQFTRRYEALEKKSAPINYNASRNASSSFNAATVFAHLMSVAVISFGAERVLAGEMTSGGLIAATLLAGRIMQPVQRALSLWVRYQDFKLSRQQVAGLFALPSIRRATRPEPAKEGHAVLRKVAYLQGFDTHEVFQNINLNIQQGEAVQLSGVSNVGKSHLLGLLAGLYAPDEGSVLVDGLGPLQYPYGALRGHVGLLKSKGEVFRGTIRDNLTSFGSLPEENVRKVTRLLGIDQDVARLPRGFDTFLDEYEGGTITPGLKQRIAIARVLAWDPSIVLFDNADRNLDRNGYRAVYRLLVHLKPNKALVLVTEDPNFAALADKHFQLRQDGLFPAVQSVAKPQAAKDAVILKEGQS